MKFDVLQKADDLTQKHKQKRRWYRLVTCMAALVVFCTVYALILPAITMETPKCGLEEHLHTDECYAWVATENLTGCSLESLYESLNVHSHEDHCYDDEGNLLCGYADFIVHTHDKICYDASGTLRCDLPEIEAHTHEAECYRMADSSEEESVHSPSDAEQLELICEKEEIEVHTHEADCRSSDGTLICGKLQVLEHQHTAICFPDENGQRVLICQIPEHQHTDECLTMDGEEALYCGYADYVVHTHDDACYDADGNLWCELPEIQEHTHEDICYMVLDIVDEDEEHVHTASCYGTLVDGVVIPNTQLGVSGDETDGVHTPGNAMVHTPANASVHTSANASVRTPSNTEKQVLICGIITASDQLETELTCEQEEVVLHTHDESCRNPDGSFKCGYLEVVEHQHTDDCIHTTENGEEPACALTLHEHTDLCYEAVTLTAEEQARVNQVISMIDALPACEEIENILLAYEEAEDLDSYEKYWRELVPRTKAAYDAYSALNEVQKSCVSNSAKLMELEWVWSATVYADSTIQVVTSTPVDAKVQIFNYDATVNDTDLGEKGYVFFQGNYADDEKEGSVDGTGNGGKGDYNKPVLASALVDGYPYVEDTSENISLSMKYLFDGTYRKGIMTGGGGLFQQDDDGYYYYDSAKNAAYFDGSDFELYDVVVRPKYTSSTGTDVQRANFLPFNQVLDNHVTVDTTLSTGVSAAYLNDPVDLWFGMTVEFDFFMPKDGKMDGEDMIFDFHGDDDVFVYIDDVLVLDIGGTHGAESASINFNTGAASDPTRDSTLAEIFEAAGQTEKINGNSFADYTKHTLKFFYMERGGNISYCRLRFNMPILPDKSLTVTKELTAAGSDAGVSEFLEKTLSYRFRVVKTDDNGNATDMLYIKPGTAYDVYEGGTRTGTGTVDTDGYFDLKAGQSAQFTNMLTYGDGATQYIVEEVMPDDLTGQYAGVEYEVSGAGGDTKSEEGPTEVFTAFQTDALSADMTQTVTYRNKVDVSKLGVLMVTKEAAAGASFDSDQKFQIQIKLGDSLLPVGTQYLIAGKTYTVTSAGVLELGVGETAAIVEGILSGTDYEITELGTADGGFNASYSGTVTSAGGISGSVNCTENGASGEFPLNGEVHVTVTNANYDFAGEILISKLSKDHIGEAAFTFCVEQVEKNGDSWVTDGTALPGTSIIVSSDGNTSGGTTADISPDVTANGRIVIGYQAGTTGTYYYKVSEQEGKDHFIYDDTYYIVEITAEAGSDGQNTAAVTNIWKNGTDLITAGSALEFVNQRTTDLMVTKEVTGVIVAGDEQFDFMVTVKDDRGNDFVLPQPAADADYTIADDGSAVFKLGNHGAITIPDIPIGAAITVTETSHNGFIAYHRIRGITSDFAYGDSATVSDVNDTTVIEFRNTGGYELPETGGTGTILYTLGGWLTMLTAAFVLLLYNSHYCRKEEKSPPDTGRQTIT